MSSIQERIKKTRKEARISQEETAKYLGLNRTAMVDIESGKRKVSVIELIKLCELFEKSADELLYGKENTSKEKQFLKKFASLEEEEQEEVLEFIDFKRARNRKKSNKQFWVSGM